MERNAMKNLEESMIRKISLSAVAVSLFASLASAGVDFDRGASDIKAEIANMDVAVPEPQQDKNILTDWLSYIPAIPWIRLNLTVQKALCFHIL